MRARRQGNAEQRTGVEYAHLALEEIYAGAGMPAAQEDPDILLLAASIARHGLLQPVIVRRNQDMGRYMLICGARRIRACRMAGLRSVDAVIVECSLQEATACYMEEHWVRRQPGILEEAEAIAYAGEVHVRERFALPEEMLNVRLRLLALPQSVRREIARCGLELEQAEPVLQIPDEFRQLEAVSIIAQRSLTGAQARRLVLGPEDRREGNKRRRGASIVMETIHRAVEGLKARGFPVQVHMHTQDGGICIQITMKKEAVSRMQAGNGN